MKRYEKHEMEVVKFERLDVFAGTAEFGSDTTGDIYDQFNIKPEVSDI